MCLVAPPPRVETNLRSWTIWTAARRFTGSELTPDREYTFPSLSLRNRIVFFENRIVFLEYPISRYLVLSLNFHPTEKSPRRVDSRLDGCGRCAPLKPDCPHALVTLPLLCCSSHALLCSPSPEQSDRPSSLQCQGGVAPRRKTSSLLMASRSALKVMAST